MAVLDIRLLGDPVLRKEANRVAKVTKQVRDLARDMLETMYYAEGIGLAAPQVGVSRAVIVVHTRKDGAKPLTLVNPKIVRVGRRRGPMEEGCLSIPGPRADVIRPLEIAVSGYNLRNELVTLHAEGLQARVLQHEIDHLHGVLFIDYLTPNEREALLEEYEAGLESVSE